MHCTLALIFSKLLRSYVYNSCPQFNWVINFAVVPCTKVCSDRQKQLQNDLNVCTGVIGLQKIMLLQVQHAGMTHNYVTICTSVYERTFHEFHKVTIDASFLYMLALTINSSEYGYFETE